MATPSRSSLTAFDCMIEETRKSVWAEYRQERGADGLPQMVLPGAERATDAEIAQRRALAPLKPKTIQRPCDAGLFSDEKDQLKLV